MQLTISRAAIDEMMAAAAESPDVEVCGLLLGHDTRVSEARPCRNVAPDIRDSFELDPTALIAAHRAARQGGPAPIGHYHSHPSGSLRPSPRDIAGAEPGSYGIIIAAGSIACWQFGTAGGFRAVSMLAVDNR